MPINQVQFQKGLSLSEFHDRFGTEQQCWQALYQARWPAGYRCPRCDGDQHSRFVRNRQTYFQCSRCRPLRQASWSLPSGRIPIMLRERKRTIRWRTRWNVEKRY